jgi:hypothetical protein
MKAACLAHNLGHSSRTCSDRSRGENTVVVFQMKKKNEKKIMSKSKPVVTGAVPDDNII